MNLSINYKEEYNKLLESGMFWEFYPQLTGDYDKDSEFWIKEQDRLKVLRNQVYKSGLYKKDSKQEYQITKEHINEAVDYVFNQKDNVRKITGYTGCETYGFIDLDKYCENLECENCSNRKKQFNKAVQDEVKRLKGNLLEQEYNYVRENFNLEELIEFTRNHRIELLVGSDGQYECYIDYKEENGCQTSAFTPLFTLLTGIKVYKKNEL